MSSLLLALLLFGAAEDGLRITVDTEEVELGKAFTLTVVTDGESWSDSMLAPLSARLVATTRDGREETRTYRCQAFSLHEITLADGALTLRVKPALDPFEPGSAELPGPAMAVPSSTLPWWVGGAVLLSLLVWFLRRPREEVPPPPVDPHARALERLGRLRGQRPGTVEDHVEASALLREYIDARFAVPAESWTTQQVLEALHKSEALEEVLLRCDLVKFGCHTPEAFDQVAASAEAFLREEGP